MESETSSSIQTGSALLSLGWNMGTRYTLQPSLIMCQTYLGPKGLENILAVQICEQTAAPCDANWAEGQREAVISTLETERSCSLGRGGGTGAGREDGEALGSWEAARSSRLRDPHV